MRITYPKKWPISQKRRKWSKVCKQNVNKHLITLKVIPISEGEFFPKWVQFVFSLKLKPWVFTSFINYIHSMLLSTNLTCMTCSKYFITFQKRCDSCLGDKSIMNNNFTIEHFIISLNSNMFEANENFICIKSWVELVMKWLETFTSPLTISFKTIGTCRCKTHLLHK